MSYADKIDNMLNCYIQCNNNSTAAVNLYTELYGEFCIYTQPVYICKDKTNLILHGSFNNKNIKRVRHKPIN